MAAWGSMLARVRNVVQDDIPDDDGNYIIGDADYLFYGNSALDWIASRHAPLKRATVSVDASTYLATIPSDAYRVLRVQGSLGELAEGYGLQPSSDEFTLISDTELRIGDTEAENVEVFYQGQYVAMTDAKSSIPVARWLEEAMLHYVSSRVLVHRAVSTGDVSQWNTRTDSGNPEDNPLLQLSLHYEKMAERILARRQQV